MKKSQLIIAVAAVAMASCKKNYDCECTYTNTAGATEKRLITEQFNTKSKAKKWCSSYESANTTTKYTCTLK